MTDHDINEIADARYMGLMCPPASPEAKALVNDIIKIIEQAEQRQRARKAKDMAAFRSAVGLIVGDLLIAVEVKEHGWSYHGLPSVPIRPLWQPSRPARRQGAGPRAVRDPVEKGSVRNAAPVPGCGGRVLCNRHP